MYALLAVEVSFPSCFAVIDVVADRYRWFIGFARQFNLKTHMQTHNPDRAKPFACTHKGCGRAFSRKHDLMRHTTSIHRVPASEQQIGVGSSARVRCDQCGKSSAGNESGCDCEDEK